MLPTTPVPREVAEGALDVESLRATGCDDSLPMSRYGSTGTIVHDFFQSGKLSRRFTPNMSTCGSAPAGAAVTKTIVLAEPERPRSGPVRALGCLGSIMPSGGFFAGVFNLAGSSLGAGILGLPNAMHASGWVLCTFYLVVILLLTIYSMRLLAIVTVKTGIDSYEGTARVLFGRGGDIFVAVIMFIKCFGACIAYVICVSDLWHAFLKDDRITGYYASEGFRRVLTTIIFLLLMLPLSLPKHINSLRYVSLVGVSFIVYFCLCVIAHSVSNGMPGLKNKEMEMVRSGHSPIRGLSLVMFSFLAQSNAYEVAREMRPKMTVRRMEAEVTAAMGICTVLYWLTGFFGYADLGNSVSASLLPAYSPLKNFYLAVAYCGFLTKLAVAYALHLFPARDAVYHLLGWNIETIAWWKNAVLCTCMALLSLVAGLWTPDVNIVFSGLGAITGSCVAFIFPSYFMMYSGGFSWGKMNKYDYCGPWLLLVCGVTVLSFGACNFFYELFH